MALTFELMPTIMYLFWVLITIRRKKKSLLFIPQIHPKIKGVINILQNVGLFIIATLVWIILNETIHYTLNEYCKKKVGTVKLEQSAASDSLWSWDSWVDDAFDFQIMFPFEDGEEEANGGRCDPDFLTWCVTGLGALILLCTTRTEESLFEIGYRGLTKVSGKVSRRLSRAFGRNRKTEVDTSVLQMDARVESETDLENIPALTETDEDGSEILQD